MIGPLVTAMRTLTVLAVPGRDTPVLCRSTAAFPVAGAVAGGAAALTLWGLASVLPGAELFACVAAVAVEAVLTGGLHLDGAADTADGLGGGRTRERALEIMKDSRIGSFGAIAMALDIAARMALYDAVLAQGAVWVVFWAAVLSRGTQACVLSVFAPARPDGAGAAFSSRGWARLYGLSGMAVAVGACVTHLGIRGALMAAACLCAGFALSAYSTRRLGGITGDTVGAGSELATIAALAVALVPVV